MTFADLQLLANKNGVSSLGEIILTTSNNNAAEGELVESDIKFSSQHNIIYIKQRDYEDNEYPSGDF